MASERFQPDANFKAGGVVGGYSSADAENAASPTLIVARFNPTTRRLLVDVNGATTVTDGEAVDAADTGTLVLGTDGSNYQILSTTSTGVLNINSELPDAAALADNTANPTVPGVAAYLMSFDGTTWDRLQAIVPSADSLNVSQAAQQGVGARAFGYMYNGTSMDRVRNNIEASVLSSSARTTTTNSTDQTNYNNLGVQLILNVTVNPGGAETLSLKIQAKDSVSGNYIDIADAGVLFTAANGTKALTVYPGILAADFVSGNIGKAAIVPRTWRAVVTHSSTGSWTYSLSVAYIL